MLNKFYNFLKKLKDIFFIKEVTKKESENYCLCYLDKEQIKKRIREYNDN
ncbi:MAG: hypothetical protein PHF86_10610 [Candidatus Nanoarchaeia archaeon]|jgi:hypothetical protein|nr:hypothetical protein [Candidatus Nanoarchaeia archaeon]